MTDDWLVVTACITHETWSTIEGECSGQMGIGGNCYFVQGMLEVGEDQA